MQRRKYVYCEKRVIKLKHVDAVGFREQVYVFAGSVPKDRFFPTACLS